MFKRPQRLRKKKKKHKMRKIHFSSDSVATDQHLPYF